MMSNPNERVVITGIGIISPIGNAIERFWPALLSGQNGIRPIKSFDTSQFRTHFGGEVQGLEPEAFFECKNPTLARGSLFAVAAAKMAIEDAKLDLKQVDLERVAVSCGTTMGETQVLEKINRSQMLPSGSSLGPELPFQYSHDAIPANVARELGLGGPITMITTACAAGNYAIGHARDLLRERAADVALVGGADPLSQIAFTGFNAMIAVAPQLCQPFDRNRKGMVVSEGSAMLVLERLPAAIKRGARIYAEVIACGISNDAHHMTSPHPQAAGAIRAMNHAIQEAQVPPEAIDYISAHGTGTPANDRIETLAIKTVFGSHAYHVPVSSIKSMIGHTMGAASAIEAAVCAKAIAEGMIPPTINYRCGDPQCDLDYVPNEARAKRVNVALSNAFAFGGNCSALILKRCEA